MFPSEEVRRTVANKESVLRLTLSLLLLCGICSALVAGTRQVTAPLIATRQDEVRDQSFRNVLPEVRKLSVISVSPSRYIRSIRESRDSAGHVNGYIYQARARGYGDNIELLVGINHPEGTIGGVNILNQNETPGLGAHCRDAAFTDQFRGLRTDVPLAVTKTKRSGDIQAITSATITSKAVVRAVNAVLVHYKGNYYK